MANDIETNSLADVPHNKLFRDSKDSTLPDEHPINALGAWRKFVILVVLTYSGFLGNFR